MTLDGNEIKLKTVLNFRDIAGQYTGNGSIMKNGLVYRSANLDKISNSDLDKLMKLGIRTIIDLRGPSELKKKAKEMSNMSVLRLPLDFDGKTRKTLYPLFYQKNSEEKIIEVSRSLYLEIADAAAPVLAKVIDAILSPGNGAVLIHCQAGKDRTGIIVALIHLLAGTHRVNIISDYLRSNDELIPYFKRIMIVRKIISLGFFPYSRVIFAIRVKQNNIEAVIERVLNHPGGIEGYLDKTGFEISKLKNLREKLTENEKN
jgi:protein-tyrosine phosphatase